MQLEDIKAFCVVCEQRSLSKAARKLAISTPMMTRRMNRLESQLKTKLLLRTTRLVEPTELGQQFYLQSLDIMKEYEAALKGLQDKSQQVGGVVKIGLPVSLSHLWVSSSIQSLLSQFPDLSVEIVNGNHLLGLLSEGFDLVVHCSKLPDSNYYYQKIRDWNKVTCASPLYFKNFGIPEHPDDLAAHNCLDHYDNFNNTWRYVIEGKDYSVFVNGNIKVNSSIDLKNLAVSDLGVIYLPDFSVYPELASGRLQTVLEGFWPEKQSMYAVYSSKRSVNKKAQVVLDYLVDLLGGYSI